MPQAITKVDVFIKGSSIPQWLSTEHGLICQYGKIQAVYFSLRKQPSSRTVKIYIFSQIVHDHRVNKFHKYFSSFQM